MRTFFYVIAFIILFVLVLALAFVMIAAVSAIPAAGLWLIWTKFGLGSMIVGLPAYWQAIPFLHIWGITLIIGLLKGIIFPNKDANNKINAIKMEHAKVQLEIANGAKCPDFLTLVERYIDAANNSK
jgi:hypothetical protein